MLQPKIFVTNKLLVYRLTVIAAKTVANERLDKIIDKIYRTTKTNSKYGSCLDYINSIGIEIEGRRDKTIFIISSQTRPHLYKYEINIFYYY